MANSHEAAIDNSPACMCTLDPMTLRNVSTTTITTTTTTIVGRVFVRS